MAIECAQFTIGGGELARGGLFLQGVIDLCAGLLKTRASFFIQVVCFWQWYGLQAACAPVRRGGCNAVIGMKRRPGKQAQNKEQRFQEPFFILAMGVMLCSCFKNGS
jgi:hypothetical protein